MYITSLEPISMAYFTYPPSVIPTLHPLELPSSLNEEAK
jgi:hypothetical protein